ncbi:MAG: DUF2520 domain-containing protein [Rhizobacter sp.]|nr:DUF2520 domain-containing protein [Chlorobiales bacterium]
MIAATSSLKTADFRVALVGAGTLGSAMAKGLAAKGYHFSAVINRTIGKAEKLAISVGSKVFADAVFAIPPDTNLIIIAAGAAEIPVIAKDLARGKLSFKNLYAVHVSGALTSDALQPLADRGASVLSLHPFQTFPRTGRNGKADGGRADSKSELFNCYFGLQAAEVEGLEIGKKLAHDLGGKVMLVPKDAKTLYHTAAVMMSNYLVTLTSVSAEIFGSLGLKPKEAFKVFEPIIQSTLANIKAGEDISDALTGPIERGDAGAVERHLTELSEQMPHLIPTYAALAMETVRVAIRKGSITKSEAVEILDLLETFSRRESEI